MSRTEQIRQRRDRERRWLHVALVALGVLIATTALSYYWFAGASMPSPKRKQPAAQAGVLPNMGKVNIVVMGVDQRSDDVGRSDTLFLITLDTRTKETALLSIPRDTRVKIPGHGFDKINHAYANGGHALTQRTVEELIGAPVDYYVEIDFDGFKKIVDAVGGVDIAVEKRMYYEDPYDNLVIDLQPGLQHLDGATAIKYVRYRDEEGDLGRVERQQHFIRAMLDEVTSPGILVKLPAIISELDNAINTDLSVAEMIGLGKALQDARQQGLKTDTVPGTPIYIDGISYLDPDMAELRLHMAKVLGIAADSQYLAVARRVAAEYENSLPKQTVVADKVEPPAAVDPDRLKAKAPEQPRRPDTPRLPVARESEPEAEKKRDKPKSSLLRVDIVNASGDASALPRMASQLRQQGFSVARLSSSGNVSRNTVVISHSSQDSVLDRLTGLPFNYALQVSPQDGRTTQVTVVIGQDFSDR